MEREERNADQGNYHCPCITPANKPRPVSRPLPPVRTSSPPVGLPVAVGSRSHKPPPQNSYSPYSGRPGGRAVVERPPYQAASHCSTVPSTKEKEKKEKKKTSRRRVEKRCSLWMTGEPNDAPATLAMLPAMSCYRVLTHLFPSVSLETNPAENPSAPGASHRWGLNLSASATPDTERAIDALPEPR